MQNLQKNYSKLNQRKRKKKKKFQWHSLSREEQSIYYEKARQERQLHMELYPGWSARDNYGYGSKKKKRKKDRSPADSGGTANNKFNKLYINSINFNLLSTFVSFIPFFFFVWFVLENSEKLKIQNLIFGKNLF